jgi:3-phenylpropionate/trans-cinnamate dioxygenase ferredoxin reductase subunit
MTTPGTVIVGAGECGARAAFALRENGCQGPITLLGSERHLPYERPPLSKSTLLDVEGHKPIAAMDKYTDANIDLRLGSTVEAIRSDEHAVVLTDGTTLAYDKLLLATGARPRRLPVGGPSHGRVKYLRTFDDAVDLKSGLGVGKRLAIIGAGFIGLELAATARALGTTVSVIEPRSRVLMRGVPEPIAEVIASRHKAEGVDIRCGTGLSSLAESTEAVILTLSDGSTLTADIVIVGIGAVPNAELAAASGIAVENGIAVDATLRTNLDDIFAAGDCCSFPLPLYGDRRLRLEAWRNAQDQGNLAARNMLGGNETISAVPYFWSDQYDLTLQVAGLADGATEHVRRDADNGAFLLFHLGADGRLLAASGIGPGTAIGRDIKLAEKLIANGVKVSPDALASPDVRLKSLLAA